MIFRIKEPHYIQRLGQVLHSWRGTPYRAGQQCKQHGVDCVGFVCRVLDEMRSRDVTMFDRFPAELAFHDRERAVASVAALVQRFAPVVWVKDNSVEPGDVLVVEPMHALVVGIEPHHYWHASTLAGVVRSGDDYFAQHRVTHVLRAQDRGNW